MRRIAATIILLLLVAVSQNGFADEERKLQVSDKYKVISRSADKEFFTFDIKLPPDAATSYRFQMKVTAPTPGRKVLVRILSTHGVQPFVSRFEGKWAEIGEGTISGFVYSPRIVYAGKQLRLVVQRLNGESEPYAVPSGVLMQLPVQKPSAATQWFDPTSRGVPTNSVVRITIAPYKGNPNAKGYCSGALIGDGTVLLTAAHCLEALPAADNPCEYIKLEAGATSDRDGEELECKRKLLSSPDLDYAFLEVSPKRETSPPIGIGAITRQGNVSILGYPLGMPLMSSSCKGLEPPSSLRLDTATLRRLCSNSCIGGELNGRLVRLAEGKVNRAIQRHLCLTRNSNSGGPVLQDGKIVAVHKGSDLRLGGTPDEDKCAGCLNESLHLGNWAVSACSILDDALSRPDGTLLSSKGIRRCG